MTEANNCCGTTANKKALLDEIHQYKQVIEAQQRRIGEEQERRAKEVQAVRDSLAAMVDASLRVNGRLRVLAIKNGYNPAGELNELEYLLQRFEEVKQERDEALAHGEQIKHEFPLFDDEGLDQHEHCCEWALQQDRKRLHKILQRAQQRRIGELLQERDARRQTDPVAMVPYLKNRADMVDGHYCIARMNQRGYAEFWNEKQKEWCGAGTVFELGKARGN